MKGGNIVLAIAAAVMAGFAIDRAVEADWAGPVAAAVIMGALIGIERARKGKRDAR